MHDITAAEAAKETLLDIDDKARRAAQPYSDSFPVKALSWLSEAGDQPQMRLIAVGLVGAGAIRQDSRMLRAGVRMLLAHELATAMKNFVKRRVDRSRPGSAENKQEAKPRPGRNAAKEETSFPSGHSAGPMAVACAFSREYPEHSAPALAAAGAVALAQIPRCAHYPTDIAAGLAIGVAAEAAVAFAERVIPAPLTGRTPPFTVRRLSWSDEEIGLIELPARTMRIRSSFGSGLARRARDPEGIVWAVGDRGPNLKAKTLVKLYGLESMRPLLNEAGAKVMPRLDLGPAIARLKVHGDWIELLETLRLIDSSGAPVSGLPVPGGDHARSEPAFDMDGKPLAPDPSGLDTEGIAALGGGGFWLGDEFGPSLLRADAHGRIEARYVPAGVTLPGARYPVRARLPAIAARRQLNRGFEAIALSGDEKWLFLAFQSPLAHPDEAAHEAARHVRIWRLDASTLEVAAQYLYPLDTPDSFLRDATKGAVEWSDIKVSELVWLGEERLLVLERASETTKIYRVGLEPDAALPPEHLDAATRPTIEELSGEGRLRLPELRKELVFTSDQAPEVGADLEGMVVLSPTELLLVNDNDFGVEGAKTSFWKIDFAGAVLC